MRDMLDTFVASDLTVFAKAFFATFFVLGLAGVLGGLSALVAFALRALPLQRSADALQSDVQGDPRDDDGPASGERPAHSSERRRLHAIVSNPRNGQ